MFEDYKWRLLGSLLSRTQNNGRRLEDYFKAIGSMEEKLRQSYYEHINFDLKFIEMMVLDGCFIIETFRTVGLMMPRGEEDPIFNMQWVYPFLKRDFIKIENQIPFFVLQRLYDLSKEDGDPSLAKLALIFFNKLVEDAVIENYCDTNALHLLHFLRSIYVIPVDDLIQRTSSWQKGIHYVRKLCRTGEPQVSRSSPRTSHSSTALPRTGHSSTWLLQAGTQFKVWASWLNRIQSKINRKPHPLIKMIPCATKLYKTGSKFKGGVSSTILDIKFRHGAIKIPTLTIDAFISTFFLNCIAFEQCHGNPDKHMSTYATFLSHLINSPKDLELLRDCDVIESFYGADEELAKFFYDLGKDVMIDIKWCYLSKLYEEINEYYRKSRHVQWATFKHTYLNTPWSCISLCAAIFLLLLTSLQSFYAVYAYHHPKK